MKILITGIAGTIGNTLKNGLSKEHDVVGIDLVPGVGVTDLVDLTDRSPQTLARLDELFRGVEAVIHLALSSKAGGTKLDEVYTDLETRQADQVNKTMGEDVLWTAHNAGVGRFIFPSSVHAALGGVPGYRDPRAMNAEEHRRVFHRPKVSARHVYAPSGGAYGATKIYLEMMGYNFAFTHGMPFVGVRFGNVRKDDDPNESDFQRGRELVRQHSWAI